MTNMPYRTVVEGLALAVVVFYSSTLAMKLPTSVMERMASTPAKIAALAIVLSISTRKPTLSLALAVGIFASVNVAQHRGFWEQFSGEQDYEIMPYKSAERLVPGPAMKNAIFKTRQRMRIAKDERIRTSKDGKNAGVTADDNLFQTAPYGFDISV